MPLLLGTYPPPRRAWRNLRSELQAVLDDWPSAQLASAVHGGTSWWLWGSYSASVSGLVSGVWAVLAGCGGLGPGRVRVRHARGVCANFAGSEIGVPGWRG